MHRVDGAAAEVEVPGSGRLRARTPVGTVTASTARMTLAVRPEKLAADVADGSGGRWNGLDGSLADVVYLGPHSHYVVSLPGGGTVTVHRQNRPHGGPEPTPTPGEPVRVVFPPEAATLLAE